MSKFVLQSWLSFTVHFFKRWNLSKIPSCNRATAAQSEKDLKPDELGIEPLQPSLLARFAGLLRWLAVSESEPAKAEEGWLTPTELAFLLLTPWNGKEGCVGGGSASTSSSAYLLQPRRAVFSPATRKRDGLPPPAKFRKHHSHWGQGDFPHFSDRL